MDHFIAWTRYSVNLGHNFVLADSRWNAKKRERAPAYEHLAGEREEPEFGEQIRSGLEKRRVISELTASN